MAKQITPFLDLCSWLLVNEYTHVSGKQSPINEDAAMMNKAWIFCLPVLFCVYSCLTLGVGAAQAQCSAWQFNVLLPKIGCSPQSIQQICSGQRPVPTNGSCPDAPVITPTQAEGATPYENFEALVERSGIDLSKHPTYTESYFDQRAQQFCALLSDGNMTKLMIEVSQPPVVHMTESTNDRPRLETAIVITGTPAVCPSQDQKMRSFVNSIMRQ